MNPFLIIARQQFSDIVMQPLVILVVGVLILLSILNGAASSGLLPFMSSSAVVDDVFLSVGVSNTLYHTSILLSILSMFIGVFSIAEERSGGSIGVLLTKPLYRRDVIGGKFVGLSLFLFLVTAMIVVLCVCSIMVFYGGPFSFEEMILRVSSYIFVLSVNCILTLGVSFMIGIWFKNIFEILLFNGIFMYANWFYSLPPVLQGLNFLIPAGLYVSILEGGSQHYILRTSVLYEAWLSTAFPYIVFMLLAVLAIFILSCYFFNTEGRD